MATSAKVLGKHCKKLLRFSALPVGLSHLSHLSWLSSALMATLRPLRRGGIVDAARRTARRTPVALASLARVVAASRQEHRNSWSDVSPRKLQVYSVHYHSSAHYHVTAQYCTVLCSTCSWAAVGIHSECTPMRRASTVWTRSSVEHSAQRLALQRVG